MSPSDSRFIDVSFPPELLLESIQQLPFGDGSIITTLYNIHPRITSLLRVYQQSITRSFVKKELQHAPADFPRSPQRQGYKWLRECVKRYDVVDDVMAVLMSDLYVLSAWSWRHCRLLSRRQERTPLKRA
jgi:hypothetical protein